MIVRGRGALAVASLAACAAVFGVNLSYPEWTGGWSTGPRLLTPLLPFAMIPIAALLGGPRWIGKLVWPAAIGLTLAGAALILMFQAVGARMPQDVQDPLVEVVWPLWRGDAVPMWWTGERFARNLFALVATGVVDSLPPAWSWIQFAPLVVFQAIGAAVLMWAARPEHRSALGVDQ
jgi:hypothetical protein